MHIVGDDPAMSTTQGVVPLLPQASASTSNSAQASETAANQQLTQTAKQQSAAPSVSVPENTQPTLDMRQDSSGKTYYAVVDPATGEVIEEIPSDEVRRVGRNIQSYLKARQAQAAHKVSAEG